MVDNRQIGIYALCGLFIQFNFNLYFLVFCHCFYSLISSFEPTTISSYILIPVPAGILCPTITFSFNPSKWSSFPATAASLSTFVVSWNEAAEINDLVCSEALVIPCNTGVAVAKTTS